MNATPQAAALPVRNGLVCLVTSRNRRRWVIPKGCVDPGHTPAQAAVVEAWEEAGLVGDLHPEPIGSYQYEKTGRSHHVTVFVLQVTDEKSVWPERAERTRVWLPPAEAVGRIDEPGLRALFRKLLLTPAEESDDPLAPMAAGSSAE
jgi:8-oxo-dGTP pyrophosphatase MutT (NUDIX family)